MSQIFIPPTRTAASPPETTAAPPASDAQSTLGNAAVQSQIASAPPEAAVCTPDEATVEQPAWAADDVTEEVCLDDPTEEELPAVDDPTEEVCVDPSAPTSGPTSSGPSASTSTTPATPAVTSGMGASVDDLINRSPTLQSTLSRLQGDGWTITTGTAGAGTFADRGTKTITLDPNDAAHPAVIVQSIAHETGHANYALPAEIPMAGLDHDQYVEQNTDRDLADEAEATIMNLQVRDELNQGDHAVDIGVAGQQSATYQALWQQYQSGAISREDLVHQIAQTFSHGEVPSVPGAADYHAYYSQQYEDSWSAAHPAPPATGTPPASAPPAPPHS